MPECVGSGPETARFGARPGWHAVFHTAVPQYGWRGAPTLRGLREAAQLRERQLYFRGLLPS